MFQMLGVFAEFERSMIKERVRAGLARAKDAGIKLGRPSLPQAKEDAIRAALSQPGRPGVRKIAATTAANNGATVSQLKALFGWQSDSMPSAYTAAADRERLARESAHRLENAQRTSIPAPKRKVRALRPKDK